MTTAPRKLYFVTRQDLSPGLQTAQLLHVAAGMGLEFDSLPDTVVVVTVSDEAELLDLNERLDREERDPFVWLEPDLDCQITALGVVIHGGYPPLERLPLLHPDNDQNDKMEETGT